MRRNPTSAEHALWRALRAKTADGLKFRRQAPIGRYIADFYCAETRMVVELDGASHDDAPEDAVRDAWMRGQGITVLRFWNNEVLGNLDGVLRIILSAIPHGTP